MNQDILLSAESVKELLEKGDDVLVIDVRDAADYEKEHISGAVSVPDFFYHLTTTATDQLESTYAKFEEMLSAVGLKPGQKAVLYEDGLTTRFGGSCRGWWILNYLGHTNAAILDKGFSHWKSLAFPVDSEAVTVTPSSFKVAVNTDIIAMKDEVLAAIDDPNVVLLDNRDAREWYCEGSSPYDADGKDFSPRRGRIPGAKWVEWYSLMDSSDTPTFKSAEEITSILAEQGITKDDDIIIYCFKGSRASNTLAALKMAGFTKLRNYLGSWYEWSADESLPIELAKAEVA
ncbi:MAG: sulfurtransferase [Cellvibrionaceae bacterium]|nr:sulfurtransferase [Cellvibrionaceae bacterium]